MIKSRKVGSLRENSLESRLGTFAHKIKPCYRGQVKARVSLAPTFMMTSRLPRDYLVSLSLSLNLGGRSEDHLFVESLIRKERRTEMPSPAP